MYGSHALDSLISVKTKPSIGYLINCSGQSQELQCFRKSLEHCPTLGLSRAKCKMALVIVSLWALNDAHLL